LELPSLSLKEMWFRGEMVFLDQTLYFYRQVLSFD
jgi:hypothetical protein